MQEGNNAVAASVPTNINHVLKAPRKITIITNLSSKLFITNHKGHQRFRNGLSSTATFLSDFSDNIFNDALCLCARHPWLSLHVLWASTLKNFKRSGGLLQLTAPFCTFAECHGNCYRSRSKTNFDWSARERTNQNRAKFN